MTADPFDPNDPFRPVMPSEQEALRATIDIRAIRGRLGRKQWGAPEEFGEGWMLRAYVGGTIIVTTWREGDDMWLHASMSGPEGRMPNYNGLKMLHAAVWLDGHAYQCFVPEGEHVNITANVLHLWGRADGVRVLPDFGRFRTI